jgi:hypothetical protein
MALLKVMLPLTGMVEVLEIISHVTDLVTDCIPVDFCIVVNPRKADCRKQHAYFPKA